MIKIELLIIYLSNVEIKLNTTNEILFIMNNSEVEIILLQIILLIR